MPKGPAGVGTGVGEVVSEAGEVVSRAGRVYPGRGRSCPGWVGSGHIPSSVNVNMGRCSSYVHGTKSVPNLRVSNYNQTVNPGPPFPCREPYRS